MNLRIQLFSFLVGALLLSGASAKADPCAEYASQALEASRGHAGWVRTYAQAVCSSYALAAFKWVAAKYSYDWEYAAAINVNTSQGYEAFFLVADDSYYEWELKWASHVNNDYALAAFKRIRDDSYYEFELKWAAQVHTSRELRTFLSILDTYSSWTESQLQWAATLDG